MDLSRPLTDGHEIFTSLVLGQTLKATFQNFSPIPKKLAGKRLKIAYHIFIRRTGPSE